MKHWFLILCFILATSAQAQTNSGENKPTPEETPAGGPGEPNNNTQVSIGKEKTDECAKENESPFSLYKDTYLLMGYSDSIFNKNLVFKFQLSAKFRMPIHGVYLAYTQRSFMDVLKKSAPFTDHSFEPELYYIYSFSDRFNESYWLRSVQAGYRHSSNGRDGTTSRSWDRLYVDMELKHKGLYISPTVWFPFLRDPDNKDVENYYGYGELLLAYVWDDDIRVSGLFHAGTDWPKGNIKADLSLPFQLFFNTLAKGWKQSNLWFQVFEGYGETFLGFRESSTAIAVGVGFRPDFDK
jgi:phospholipase A1